MRKLIILAMLANIGLAIGLICALRQRPAPLPALTPTPGPAAATPSRPAPPRPRVSAPAAKSAQPMTAVAWQLLAHAELHAGVAALRKVSCPEQTIQDIIVAEVNRRYAPREQALKLRYENYDLWDAPPPGTRSALERKLQLAELFREKKALLKELLGVDVPLELPRALAGSSLPDYDGALQALPEGKRSQVKSIQEAYLAQMEKLRARTLNYLEPEDVAELIKFKQEQRQALKQTLTVDELLDFDLKTSNLSRVMKGALQGVTVSDAEFRGLFQQFQRTLDEAALSNRSTDPSALLSNLGNAQRELLNSDLLKNTLGEGRHTELLRSRDPVYRQVQQTGQQAGLPPDSIGRLYELQKAAQQELASQFANQSLSQEDRQRLGREIQEKALRATHELLGDEAFRKLEQSGALPIGPRVIRRNP